MPLTQNNEKYTLSHSSAHPINAYSPGNSRIAFIEKGLQTLLRGINPKGPSSLHKFIIGTFLLILPIFLIAQTGPGGVQDTGGSSSLVLWLDANTISLADGADIANWSDQSGYGNDAVGNLLNDGSSPEYHENAINGYSQVEFIAANDDYFGVPHHVSLMPTTISMFVVGNVTNAGQTWGGFANKNGGAWDDGYGIGRGDQSSGNDQVVIGYVGDYTSSYVEDVMSYSVQSIYSMVYDKSQIRLYRNEGTPATFAHTADITSNTDPIYIGWTGGYMDGDIAEMIILNRAATAAERIIIHNYLAAKYGLTLSSNDLYTGDNTGYGHDVAGIGQASDGSNQTDAIGTGTVRISDADGLGNGEFLFWGHDNGTLNMTASDIDPDYEFRLEREWRASVTGTPGSVTVKMIYSGNDGDPSHYALLLDNDGTFASGATDHAASSISGDTVIFNNITFTNGDYFTLAEAIASPGGVGDDLTVWFKANAGVTGSPVTSWADQSPKGNDATQAGTGDYATLATNIHNGNPAIYFTNGDNGYFEANLDAIKGDDYNLIAIVERDNSNSDSYLVGTSCSGCGANQGLHFGYRNDTEARLSHYGNNLDVTVNAFDSPTQSLSLLRGQLDTSTGKTIYELRDGTAVSNNDANTATVAGGQGVIGKGYGGSRGFEGYVSEVIAYSATLSDTELRKIYSYLAIKYGFALDNSGGGEAGDYEASDGTLLWDASTNADYHNDIAGIGRDDMSELNQLASTSEVVGAMLTITRLGSFSDDLSFLLWGNNGDDAGTRITADVDGSTIESRNSRVWKISEPSNVGTVDIAIDLTNVPGGITGSDLRLLIDRDGDGFEDLDVTPISGSYGSNVFTITGVDLQDGDILTVGSINKTQTPLGLNSPGGVIGNLVAWFKGNEGVTGTSPVSGWKDWSVTGNDAWASGTPELTENSLNYNAGIDFVESETDFFALADPSALPTGSDARTYLVVASPGASGVQPTFGHGTDNTAERVDLSHSTDEVAVRNNGPSDVMTHTVNTPYLAIHNYGTGEFIDPGLETKQNGLALTHNYDPSASSTALNTGTTTARIGRSVNGSQEYTGKILEIIVYDRDLTETAGDAEKAQSYLALKYGITLDADIGNYLASDGTVVWDATANASYHNDLFGIGRDDPSSLDQRKSVSTNDDAMVIIDKGTSFKSDASFLIVGNDDAPTATTSTGTDPLFQERLERTWKVALTGAPGSVTVQIVHANTGSSRDYGLHVDTDGDFTTDATTYNAASISGDTITFNNVSFSNGDFFTLGSGRVAPGGVSNEIRLWLRADMGVTGSGTATEWSDLSGYGYDTYATGNPQIQASSINFNTAIDFDGSDYFTTTASDILAVSSSGQVYTAFVILESDDPGVERAIVGNTGGVGHGLSLYHNTSSKLAVDHVFGLGTAFGGGKSLTAGIPSVATIRYQMSDSENRARLDGTQFDEPTNTAVNHGWGEQMQIGRDQWISAFDGRIAEVILYETKLSDTDIDQVESYLAIRTGATLDYAGGTGGDITASDGMTVFWDASDYSTYHNDVAGIGRDDGSSLSQQKSISANSDAMIIMDHGQGFTSDLDFIFWGNNDAPTSLTTVDKDPAYDSRMEREWRVKINGNPGPVTLQMLYAGNNGAVIRYGLHVDSDGTFASGATSYIASDLLGDTITFENVVLSDGDYITLGVIGKGPGGVLTDLNLWLRADRGTNTTTNGEGITSWLDQSGEANHGTGTGAAAYAENFASYNPGVNFTDDVQPISGTIERTNGTASTIFIVGEIPVVNDKALFEIGDGPSPTTGRQYFLDERYAASGSVYALQTNLTSVWTVSDPGGATAAAIFENGYNSFSSKDFDTDWTTGGGYILGDDETGANRLIGEIAEVIYFDRQLSASEQQRAESYIALKYGITLSTDNDGNTTALEAPNANGVNEGDYLASDGTMIWDASANSTYHNDVTGIGRDDLSALDQPTSISSSSDAMVIMDKGESFSSDLDFIMWGNDNGTTGLTLSDSPPNYDLRLIRKWQASVSGTPGTVTVRFLYSSNSGVVGDYVLHVDDDGTFATGSVNYPASEINGDTITIPDVSFNDGDLFTLGIASRGPGGIDNNLTLWLKSNDGFKNGGTPVTSGAVDEWSEASGNGSFGSLLVDTGSPTLISNHTNYNPSIYFDGVDDKFEKTNFDADVLFDDRDNTLFLVMETTSLNDTDVIGGWESDASGDRAGYYELTGSDALRSDVFGDGNRALTSGSSFTSSRVLVRTYSDASGRNLHINGTLEASTTAGSMTATGNNGDFALGNQPGNTDIHYAEAYISEYVCYNTALSDADIQKVESYFAVKYGITMSNSGGGTIGDYVASDGTLVWDASDNASYHNDIIALGRDDYSALYQKQSKSQDDSLIVWVGDLSASNQVNTAPISNEISYLVIGHNGEALRALDPQEAPVGIRTRFNREWKVTTTNFTDEFSLEIEWDSIGNFDIEDIRLLVDDDGDFSDASIYGPADGLTFSVGSIVIEGINNSHIPANGTSYITLGSTTLGTTLPIELIEFEATLKEEQQVVELRWQTASEINNDFFTVEKSANGSDWEILTTIEGAGNSVNRRNYATIDDEPYYGPNYYRLKQTDFDGGFSYSEVRIVSVSDFEKAVNIYPNPVTTELFINGDPGELAELRVMNIMGQDITARLRRTQIDPNQLLLDTSQLPPGLYTLLTGKRSIKFVKRQ